MTDATRLGNKLRALRRREGLSQVQLAERLAISASYLNLIEHGRRPMPATLLIKLAQLFHIDVQALAADDGGQLAADVMEALGDEMFEGQELTQADVQGVREHEPLGGAGDAEPVPGVSGHPADRGQSDRAAGRGHRQRRASGLAVSVGRGERLHPAPAEPFPRAGGGGRAAVAGCSPGGRGTVRGHGPPPAPAARHRAAGGTGGRHGRGHAPLRCRGPSSCG